MNKKQIEKWGYEADSAHPIYSNNVKIWVFNVYDLHRFAALVAAHEREQCALVCDAMGNPWRGSEDCSAAIRQRNNQQSK